MYIVGLKDKCKKEKRIECKNGGFPHPRRCETECICPGGYGGKRCDEPANNGERLNATANPQVLQAKVDKFDRKGSLGQYANRTYWIESPAHTVIEIEVAVESFFMDTNGCAKAAVEIKTNKNQTLTGYRFCSHGDRGIKLTSHSNLVPIIVYNRDPSIEFEVKITYHYVSENAQGQE
ncbi:hypothetical protein Y032_0001g148 [Ancylostoma ceylanicum]|uniref:EGF-like domain-containing protein n=1 Tax=Ancylostoma ceylanicum TaxID=53326 RepID=A0A016W4H0_9BILA|nr:hypothetical protein Y032_0001g148 [Ancylostoma ceylanicum]